MSVIYSEILRIVEEQRALSDQQAQLQNRLEELVVTLRVKGEYISSSTPAKTQGVKKVVIGHAEDDDDLGPAPIEFSIDASTLESESGWDHVTPQSSRAGGKSFGASSLSLSYSFSPVTNNTRNDISEGLSPAPLESTQISSATPKPTPTAPRDIIANASHNTASSSSSSAAAAASSSSSAIIAGASNAIEAATMLLFGSPQKNASGGKDASVPVSAKKEASSAAVIVQDETSLLVTAAAIDLSNEKVDVDTDVKTVQTPTTLISNSEGPLSAVQAVRPPTRSVSDEVKANREGQAANMTLTALTQNLNAWLVKSGAVDKQRGLKEIVDECCKRMNITCSGNLKRDATSCFVLTGAQNWSPPPSPKSSPKKNRGSLRDSSDAGLTSSGAAVAATTTTTTTTTTAAAAATAAASSLKSPPPTPPMVPVSASAPTLRPAPVTGTIAVPVPGTPVAPLNPHAYTIFSPTSTSSFTSRLREFYKIHNPTKIGEIESIASKFAGRESQLITKLEALYNAKFPL